MIPEGVRVAHIAAQGVDRLVPAHVHHLEQRRTSGGCGREEAGAEAVAGEHFWVEPEALGIGLDDQGDVLRRQPTWKQPAALADLPEDRPFDDAGSGEPLLDRGDRAGDRASSACVSQSHYRR